MNPTGTDFIYSSNLTFTNAGTRLGAPEVWTEGTEPFQARTTRIHVAWLDFPTSGPTRRSGIFAIPSGGGGTNAYNYIAITTRNDSDTAVYANLAVRSLSNSDQSAQFNLMLSGTSSNDWRTLFKVNYDSQFWFMSETSADDINVFFMQGSTQVVTTGWDDSKAAYQISLGNDFDAANRFEVDTNFCRWYGGAEAGMLIKAATGANNARLQLDAGSTGDSIIEFLDGGISRRVIGYDESTSRIIISGGTTLGDASRYEFYSQNCNFLGSAALTFTLDAASSSCSLFIQAAATSDARILFRNDTTTRFIMGMDYSRSQFQINSSTDFGIAPDFCINFDGNMGIGEAPISGYRVRMFDSNATGTHYILNLFHDGNNATSHGMRIQAGLDTLSTSDTNYLLALDGNGTTVGAILVDSTSFRLFNAVSSKKLKKNIRDMDENVTEMFRNKKAQPKKYNFKGRNKADEEKIKERGEELIDKIGFVIEDLAEIFPDVAKELDDGHEGDGTVPAYSEVALIPYMVKMLVEMDERLQTLETP
jgi:hypothetical protein